MREGTLQMKSRFIAGLVFAGSISAGASAVSAAEKMHLALDFLPGPGYSAYFFGVQSGIYAKHGIELRITKGLGSGDTLMKLAGGAVDVGLADVSALFTARAQQKLPVKMIATVQSESPHSLFVMTDSGITNFVGLENKKIGITPGNSHKLYFPEIAKRAGTDPSKIRWVTVDAASMGPLLISGQIDAAPYYASHYYFINKQAKKAGKEIRVLPFSDVGFSIYSNAVHASEKMIKERPDSLRAFVAATLEAWKGARDNPEAACKATVAMNPEVVLEDCLGTFGLVLKYVFNDVATKDGLGAINEQRLKDTYAIVAKAQELDPNANPSDAVDTRFLPAKK